MREIKTQWNLLDLQEREQYEQKARYVEGRLKARKFKTQTWDDKRYDFWLLNKYSKSTKIYEQETYDF